jgi:hypothetical protein
MMSSRRQILLAATALLGHPWSAWAASGANMLQLRVDYTATSLVGADHPTKPGRLWRTRSALRHEGEQHGRLLTVIVQLDRNLGWLMMAGAPFVIETSLSTLDLPLGVLNGSGGMRQTREGTERVNGLNTVRIRVERNTGSGSRFTGHVWATEQGVISRLAGEGESRGRRGRTLLNFRDVRIGSLDPGLFEPPRGLQIVRVSGGDIATLLEGLEATGQFGQRR